MQAWDSLALDTTESSAPTKQSCGVKFGILVMITHLVSVSMWQGWSEFFSAI